MTELATAYISIVAETSQIPRQVKAALGQAQRDANTAGRDTGRSFASSFGTSLKGLGAAVGVTGGVAAVGAAMKSAISSGMDFTTSLNSMQAVAGATSQQVAQVGAMARQLGNDNSIASTSSVDAAQAMLELAKGGFSVNQSMQAARGTLQLAAAAQISAGEAATIQSQALQAFGLNANQAGMAADILANSANQSSAEITDVAQALQQSGSVAHQFGISMNDTAAAISLMANSGIQGSDAGTLLKSALLALTDQGAPAQSAMKELGVTAYDAQGKFVGLSSLFGQLQTASKNMSAEQYQAATATLFGSDAMRIAGIAAQQGKSGFDAMAAAMGKQGAAADVAAAKMQGLPGAWERFKNAAQDAGLAFYDAVKGPLTAAANWGAEAIGKIVDGASGVGAKIREIFASFQDAGGADLMAQWGDRLRGVFESLWGSIQQLVPVIGNVSGMFAQASAIIAAVGIETFVESLEAVSGILEASVVPVLQLANSALSGMQPVVVAAIAAWMGFRLVAPALAGVRTQVATLAATATTATGRLTALATANRAIVQTTSMGAVQMGRFGSSIAQVGQSVPLVARMQSSFVNAAAGASSFGRTAGVAAAAGTGLRAAGSGIAGVFGGPVGLALTGAVIAGTAWSASVQRQKQETEAYTTALESLSEAQKSTGQSLMESRGAKTEQVYSSLTDQIDQYTSKVDAASAADAKWHNVASDMFGDVFKGMFGADNEDISTRMDDQAGAYQNVKRSLEELGMTNEQLGRTLGGSNAQWDTFTAKLRATGAGGEQAANELQELRDKVISQADIAARVTPGVSELGAAMQKMGEKGASAADKLNALKAAMDAMNPARNKTEALAQYGEAIRKVAEAAHGIDSSAIDQSGQINAMTEAGSALSRTLADLADKSAQVASTGGDMAAVNAQNEEAFGALASATGRSVDEIRSLYNSLGGTAVDLTVRLQGAPEVTQQLAAISAQWNSVPTNKQIEVQESAVNDETRAALQRMNATVSQPMNGTVTITANDDVARSRILLITQNMSVLNAMRANPTLDLNTLSFTAQNQQALQALRTLQAQHPTPQAGMIIDQLLNGQAVSMTKLDELSRTVANPQARMEIEKIMQNIQTVNDALDRVAETRNAQIWVNYTSGNGDWQGLTEQQRADNIARNFQNLAAAQNADGSIRQYLDGGIAAAEAYANGGARLPDRALIQKPNPKGGLVQWAEPETGGEAFIPLAGSKRGRSTDILAAVAKIFGYALVPQDNLPSSISGILGALTGNTIGKLLSLSGVDRYGITAYANGGFDAAGLRKLAEGQGASRPLTGAPYVWGGVNWGDCCLVAETPVWGPDGATPIAELSPGQRVWSYVDGKLESHQVTAAWFSKTQEVFKVRTRHRAVTGSANHPFLRLVQSAPAKPRRGRRGWDPAEYDVEWARLDELRVGDLLVQPKAVWLEREVSNSLPSGRPIGLLEAWLLGVILGDGNVSDTKVEICVYGDLRNRARDVLSRMQLSASKTRGARDGIGTSDSDAHGIRAYSVEFARELAEAGFRKPAHEKRIPDCVWGWDEDRQRAFLNGYCDADGHHPTDITRHGERTYASASRALIEDVRYLHIALGDVVANVTTNRRRKPIVINGKQVKTARPLHVISVRADDRLVSSSAAERRPGVAHWTDATEFAVAPVLSITSEGVEDTYDIEVEGSHNFIAGGVVVHNSGAMSAFARAAVGLDPFGGRFSTATEASQLQAMGFTLGRGSSGDLRFGWYNGGAGGGHTAGTLPDGTNVEMGGGNGGGMLGGSVGADSPQFTEHAYLTIGPAWTDAGTDPGGFVTRPDGTIVYEPGDGNFGATGSGGGGGSSTSGGGTSISSRFGSAVGAFVEGQIADVFQTLGANDTPGIVGAIAEWENARRSDGTVDTAALKKSYDAAVAKSNEQLEKDKAALKADLDAKKITQAEYDSKLAEMQKKHDDTLAEAKSKYDEATKTAQSANGAAQQQEQQVPSDPGTSTPAPGEDLGGTGAAAGASGEALASTGNQIKDAFRSGLREAWRTGTPWTDTDWIVGKESSWNPTARNGKYWGLIQAGAEVYEAAGVSPTTTDPAEQAKAYDKYVADRYQDPMGARAHWEANNWYDDGGVGVGTGLMAKNVIRPERVLSPRQTESFEQMVRRDFQSGVGTDQIIAKLDQLIGAVLSIEGGDTVTLRDEREYYERKQRRQQARIAAAKGGR